MCYHKNTCKNKLLRLMLCLREHAYNILREFSRYLSFIYLSRYIVLSITVDEYFGFKNKKIREYYLFMETLNVVIV